MNLPKLIKLVVVIGLGLFLAAELLVRVLVSPPMDPGRVFIVSNEIAGLEKKVKSRIDSNQVRGFESTKSKPDGALRILCVGGSSTGTMLQENGNTWWGQLGETLEKDLGRKVQIGAVSAPAVGDIVSGAQWVNHLLAEIEGVDMVIAMYGHSQVLYPQADFVFDPSAIKPIQVKKDSGMKVTLAKVSHLLRLIRNGRIKSKRNAQQRKLGQGNHLRDVIFRSRQSYRKTPDSTPGPIRKSDPLAAYLHGVGMFAEFAKRNGVKVVVVGEPTIFSPLMPAETIELLHSPVHVGPGANDRARPDPGWVDSELGRYYTAAGKVCKAAGIGFINLQGSILQTRENFFTEAGLTDIGAQMAAKEILPVVKAELQ